MKQNPSCETDSYLASQETPTIYGNQSFVTCSQDPIISL